MIYLPIIHLEILLAKPAECTRLMILIFASARGVNRNAGSPSWPGCCLHWVHEIRRRDYRRVYTSLHLSIVPFLCLIFCFQSNVLFARDDNLIAEKYIIALRHAQLPISCFLTTLTILCYISFACQWMVYWMWILVALCDILPYLLRPE